MVEAYIFEKVDDEAAAPVKYVMVIGGGLHPEEAGLGFMRVAPYTTREKVHPAKKDAAGTYVPDFDAPPVKLTDLQGTCRQGTGIAGIGADGSPVDVLPGQKVSDWMDKNCYQLVRTARRQMLQIPL
jgi:hypothetical protein